VRGRLYQAKYPANVVWSAKATGFKRQTALFRHELRYVTVKKPLPVKHFNETPLESLTKNKTVRK